MGWLQNKFEKNFMISTVDYVFNWARKSAVWPMTFGLACCAIEMIASSTARFDIARFGSEVFRPSPRQSDLMIVAGTVTLKMAPVVKRIYDQMPDPKWVISMGACSSVGGPFNTYADAREEAHRSPSRSEHAGELQAASHDRADVAAKVTRSAIGRQPSASGKQMLGDPSRTRLFCLSIQ